MNILICDDERDIVSALEVYLHTAGYATFAAYDGAAALEILGREQIHLVLLDIMMPGMDGLTALSRLREKYNTPVIFLSAKSEEEDLVTGLNLGADDYITKPFRQAELLARVRSQLRRYTELGKSEEDEAVLRVGDIRLDDRKKEVTLAEKPVALTPTEYDILKFLMRHPGDVYSPGELYRRVWGDAPIGVENTVAVHIRHLREKLEIDPSAPRFIKVVWGHGYKMEKEPKATNGTGGEKK